MWSRKFIKVDMQFGFCSVIEGQASRPLAGNYTTKRLKRRYGGILIHLIK